MINTLISYALTRSMVRSRCTSHVLTRSPSFSQNLSPQAANADTEHPSQPPPPDAARLCVSLHLGAAARCAAKIGCVWQCMHLVVISVSCHDGSSSALATARSAAAATTKRSMPAKLRGIIFSRVQTHTTSLRLHTLQLQLCRYDLHLSNLVRKFSGQSCRRCTS